MGVARFVAGMANHDGDFAGVLAGFEVVVALFCKNGSFALYFNYGGKWEASKGIAQCDLQSKILTYLFIYKTCP